MATAYTISELGGLAELIPEAFVHQPTDKD